MKIAVIAGARPNFVKIAPLVEAMKRSGVCTPIVVHTGQHYDDMMSRVFFRELEMREPDHNLGVGSASHVIQTSRIMERFDKFLDGTPVDMVAVVGDVNSTVACALTAVKRGLRVAHVEAGLRSFDWEMPEEVNRVVTDVLSEFLFAPSRDAVDNLKNEGKPDERIHFVGNIMVDTLLRFLDRAHSTSRILDALDLAAGEYALLTLHRPQNVDTGPALEGMLEAIRDIQRDIKVVYPVHPRSMKMIQSLGLGGRADSIDGLLMIQPLGYLDFIELESRARFVMTDSGGVQEETTVLGVPCLTLRANTERPVTVSDGTNRVVGTERETIVRAARDILEGERRDESRVPELWDGHAAERIVSILNGAAAEVA
ncbi:MAG: UDP-N-acetylglucosamine 2-epimerase (non-hydrolyzing) [Candidatus Eisenbacteria bacterium]